MTRPEDPVRLLDANLLVALVVGDHVHHEAAERWLAGQSGGFATCPITQGAHWPLAPGCAARSGQPL